MTTEWKLVPVEPTDDMIVAFAEAWYSKRQCIDDPDMLDAYSAMLAAAPVPPAGGEVEAQMLEEMYRRFGAGKQADDWLCVDDTQLGVEFCADFMRPHVTRLTAERDALKAEVETERKFRLSAEGGWREANRVIGMQRAKLDEQESELTKARELLTEASGKLYVDTQLKLRIAHFLAHQSAPAAKGGE